MSPSAPSSHASETAVGEPSGRARSSSSTCRASPWRRVGVDVQVGQDPATGKVVEGGIEAETMRIFRNLSAVLEAAGRSFDDVARAGVYLTRMSDFNAMNGIYAAHFRPPFPARTTIGVAALPLGACVEIDLVVKA